MSAEWLKGMFVCAAALAVFGAPRSAAAADAPPAPVTLAKKIPIAGDGGWDFLALDPEARRLFVTRATRVQVVDLATEALAGEIPDTPGVHGVAFVPRLVRGYTTNGRDSSVTVFDLRTLATITKIPIPARGPDAILYESVTNRVFTFDGGTSDAVAIDPDSNRVVGRVALGGKPEVAVADGKGGVFVNLEDKSAIVHFDARSLTVKSTWPLAPGEGPTGLAFDAAHGRLFAACGNKTLVVLDAKSGKRVATVPIGDRVDGAAFDPALGLVYATCGDGTLSVIHEDTPDRYTAYAPVATQRGARTVTVDPLTHRVFTCTAQFGEAPPATADQPHPRPPMVPGSFVILALEARR